MLQASSLGQTILPDRALRQTCRSEDAPKLELRRGEPEFEEEIPLIKELRAIFDWMAQEKDATKMSHRKFTHRLPELHRRMPQIARSFKHMDRNGDCWLEWEEFMDFCLKEVSLMQQMKRTTVVTVYAKERDGQISYKELLDPRRMCDMGTVPPLLPWEVSHVVEWRVDGLQCGPTRGFPIRQGPIVVRPGTSLASPPFRAAGVSGVLKFWPSGYWTEAQRRGKVQASAPHFSTDEKIIGPHPMPPPDAWCCVGCTLPAGTHLVFRFFIGDWKSEKRECFWHEGNFPGCLWSPIDMERPPMKEGDSLRVGIEIFRNLSAPNGHPPPQHKQLGVKKRTAFIRNAQESVDQLKASQAITLENKSMSLPALPTATTWRNLDKLLQAYRRDGPDANASGRDLYSQDKTVSFQGTSSRPRTSVSFQGTSSRPPTSASLQGASSRPLTS